MNNDYQLSSDAEADLRSIYNCIAEDNERAAAAMVRDITDRLRLASTSKNFGEAVSMKRRTYRRFTVRPYVVYYRVIAGQLYVYRILHGARDIDSLME